MPVHDDLDSDYDIVTKEENLQDHDQTIIVELEPTLNTIWNGDNINIIYSTIPTIPMI